MVPDCVCPTFHRLICKACKWRSSNCRSRVIRFIGSLQLYATCIFVSDLKRVILTKWINCLFYLCHLQICTCSTRNSAVLSVWLWMLFFFFSCPPGVTKTFGNKSESLLWRVPFCAECLYVTGMGTFNKAFSNMICLSRIAFLQQIE